ncbi:MAG: DNA circularization N-terminal domain-containing protein [Bosea sp.]|uniref:DNA circularization N-terminal domain-containing protein n=1 Tax=Bosea sp. (in: a-proteobacteria) TaxID=1871050 RepID=UPI001ACE6132|nr:DNA circularization N-terminal domain-containing protein [Bosea sp. (in: a-proteobacteria)]MBN9453260.1 DNA circularization N-terminal domain-containing protein [Bosea sp. (in: a-proteobacteria)]
MRDFRPLLPGSFKGFPFQVDKETAEGGRCVPVHEYVRSEDFDTEDTGQKAPTFSVTAYLASDDVDAEATALFAVCSGPGAGLLVVDGIAPTLARCTKVKRSGDKDRMGLIAFDLEFVAAGGQGNFVSTLFDLATASAAGALASLVRPALQAIRR